MVPMPRYRSHKQVWALKIVDILPDESTGGAIIIPVEKYGPVRVNADYMQKHDPQAGGYYVVYKGWVQVVVARKGF